MKIKYLSLLFCLLLIPFGSHATHIVGGEIYYKCLGGNQYQVTLKLYRDCINGQAAYDNPAAIGIFNSSGVLITQLDLNFPGASVLPVVINNPCLQAPPNICVEEAIYVGTVNLPPLAGGYHIAYQRCCRNNTIVNIPSPNNAGSTYYAFIPGPETVTCNSSPHYNHFPPIALCAGDPLIFDHSATDPDGDSIVYEFCSPYLGGSPSTPMPNPPDPPPYSFVNFISAYSASYPLSSSPAININPQTGLITGTPNAIGQFVVGVCAKEYRNGVLLSTNKRDFQFNVTSCVTNVIAAIPSQSSLCSGTTVNFTNNSQNASFYYWDFGVPGVSSDTSIATNPSYTYPDTGSYTIMLIANPGYTCADTAYANYDVFPSVSAYIPYVDGQCPEGNNFNYTCGGNFSQNATFQWNFGTSANISSSTIQNPSAISFTGIGAHNVSVTVTDNNCSVTANTIANIYPPPVSMFNPEPIRGCRPLIVQFRDSSFSGTPLSHRWTFGDGDSSSEANPMHTYLNAGVYDVGLNVTTTNGCIGTSSYFVNGLITVEELPQAALSVSPQEASIFEPHILVSDLSRDAVSCTLYFGDGTFSDECNIQHTFPDTGIFTIHQVVSNAFGCTDTAAADIRINPEFRLFIPNAFSPNTDGRNEIFKTVNIGIRDYELYIFNRWGNIIFETRDPKLGWDGSVFNESEPAQMGVYIYKLKIRSVFEKDYVYVGTVTLVK